MYILDSLQLNVAEPHIHPQVYQTVLEFHIAAVIFFNNKEP